MSKINKEQIAVGNYHYVSHSFDYFLDSVSNIGLKNIEVWGAKPHITVDGHTVKQKEHIAEAIHNRGMNVICFCPEQNTYPVDISAEDDDFRNYSIEHMKRAIETSRILGSDRMLLCPGNGYLEEEIDIVKARFVDSVKRLLETAEKNNVTLVLETQDQVDSIFMNTVEQQKAVIEEINNPFFKAMLDTVQLAQFDDSVSKSIHTLGVENVRHVHLGNTVIREKTFYEKHEPVELSIGRSVCGHVGFREGNIPLNQNLIELAEAGYREYVTIEICQRPYFFEADRYAKEAYEYISDALE